MFTHIFDQSNNNSKASNIPVKSRRNIFISFDAFSEYKLYRIMNYTSDWIQQPTMMVHTFMHASLSLSRFAGKKAKTSTIKCSNDPVWNETLKLPCKYPSLCDSIRLRLYDW